MKPVRMQATWEPQFVTEAPTAEQLAHRPMIFWGSEEGNQTEHAQGAAERGSVQKAQKEQDASAEASYHGSRLPVSADLLEDFRSEMHELAAAETALKESTESIVTFSLSFCGRSQGARVSTEATTDALFTAAAQAFSLHGQLISLSLRGVPLVEGMPLAAYRRSWRSEVLVQVRPKCPSLEEVIAWKKKYHQATAEAKLKAAVAQGGGVAAAAAELATQNKQEAAAGEPNPGRLPYPQGGEEAVVEAKAAATRAAEAAKRAAAAARGAAEAARQAAEAAQWALQCKSEYSKGGG
eukprot:CAMPEP_0119066594 /NCGR_PEP_ID=MMETSP1178-20130426/9107_1 /TAXON_ID=33656 /ORGANISM="unid sp, Strain CCMP2000" /LENGTH=294 /DNA_ID=CAMNT_0007048205 /DNA_START=183 /DNA_END=1067 /DNA_ORIENTATION=-